MSSSRCNRPYLAVWGNLSRSAMPPPACSHDRAVQRHAVAMENLELQIAQKRKELETMTPPQNPPEQVSAMDFVSLKEALCPHAYYDGSKNMDPDVHTVELLAASVKLCSRAGLCLERWRCNRLFGSLLQHHRSMHEVSLPCRMTGCLNSATSCRVDHRQN